MTTMSRPHWTSKSIDKFVYRIATDFVVQIEKKMDAEGISQEEIAVRLKVTPGRVSQVLNNPGNLTIRMIVQYAQILGMKASIVAYDDNDPGNNDGPVNSAIFTLCWDRLGKPRDFFAFAGTETSAAGDCGDQAMRRCAYCGHPLRELALKRRRFCDTPDCVNARKKLYGKKGR